MKIKNINLIKDEISVHLLKPNGFAGNLFSVTQIQNGKRGWLFLSYHEESANWLMKFSHNLSSNSSLPSALILSYLRDMNEE